MAVYRFRDGSSIPFSDIPGNCCPHTPSHENRYRKFSTRDELLYILMVHCELKEEQAKAHADFMFDKWSKTKAEAKKEQERRKQARAQTSTSHSSGPATTLEQLEKILPPGRITTEPLPPASLTTRAKESVRKLARKMRKRRGKQHREEDEEPLL